MAGFDTGAVLGDRFEILGVLGRGGTATVYLAQDRLRSQRVALKVVHEHLSADASTRRRLHREVQSASLLRHDAALVPHDVHELEGRVGLSMPYHPGHTLEERVSEIGALPVDEVRQIGLRIAGALAAAHRAGVLHRDVTASNVLVSPGGDDCALTDFGLARLRHGGTRSTTMLGTAGYAAPEVYAGERSDPRSDLYGLGAALYLAATGRPAFDGRDPMAALRKQMDGVDPIHLHRPGFPEDLAATIEALLAPEPSDRPGGAREVVDALEQRQAPKAVAMPIRSADDGIKRQYFPPGEFTIIIRERDEDRGRRLRRRNERGRAPTTPETQWGRGLEFVFTKLKDIVGMPEETKLTPEEALANVVAEEAGLQPGSLDVPNVVFDRKFRLVDRTDASTAHRLAEAARATGFRAQPLVIGEPKTTRDWLAAYFWVPIAVGWSMLPFIASADLLEPPLWVGLMTAVSIVLPIWSSTHQGPRDPNAVHLPVAWRADLRGNLKEGSHLPPPYAVGVQPGFESASETSPTVVPPTRAERLRANAEAALTSLMNTIDDDKTGLSVPEQHDLRSTARELWDNANGLADEVERLESALVRTGAPEDEIATLERRLSRLQTRKVAGEEVSDQALSSLENALAEHESDLAIEADLEARLAATTAQLLEIASTASKVQRQIVLNVEASSAKAGVQRLQREVEASTAARREAQLKARQAQAGRSGA
ncbi:MAG: protein kinase [Myxococcota bacterium]